MTSCHPCFTLSRRSCMCVRLCSWVLLYVQLHVCACVRAHDVVYSSKNVVIQRSRRSTT